MFKYLSLFLVFSCVCAHMHDDLIKKYGEKKIFTSCFGETLTKEYYGKFLQAAKECQPTGTPFGGPLGAPVAASPLRGGFINPAAPQGGFDLTSLLKNAPSDSPFLIPVPYVSQGDNLIPLFFNPLQSLQGASPGFRTKRQAYFDEAKVRSIKDNFLQKMNTAACILRKCSFLNTNNTINYASIKSIYNQLTIDYELKQELLAGVDKCMKFVSCFPMDDGKRSPVPKGLKKALLYAKCEKKMKLKACIKKDLRRHPEKFHLEGLDGVLDDFDRDDQMLMVLKAHVKFGDDPMDLFY